MPTPPSLTPEQLFCLKGCRIYKQYYEMRHNFEHGVCIFCTLDTNRNKIVWEDAYAHCWAVPDAYLRSELEHHLIVAPKRHLRDPWGFTHDEILSVHTAQKILAQKFNLRGGIIATRFGDMSLNAGTVPHLHYNIMIPNGSGEVRIPVFKDDCDRDENTKRSQGFSTRYEAGEMPM